VHAVGAMVRFVSRIEEKSKDSLASARGGYVTGQAREEQIVYIWQARAGNGCNAMILHGCAPSQAKELRISKAPCDTEDRLVDTANERERPEQKQIGSSAARAACASPSLVVGDLGDVHSGLAVA
jgi:hypothetical protein